MFRIALYSQWWTSFGSLRHIEQEQGRKEVMNSFLLLVDCIWKIFWVLVIGLMSWIGDRLMKKICLDPVDVGVVVRVLYSSLSSVPRATKVRSVFQVVFCKMLGDLVAIYLDQIGLSVLSWVNSLDRSRWQSAALATLIYFISCFEMALLISFDVPSHGPLKPYFCANLWTKVTLCLFDNCSFRLKFCRHLYWVGQLSVCTIIFLMASIFISLFCIYQPRI